MNKRLNLNRQVTYSVKEINQMKSREREKGLKDAIKITRLLPLLVLRDLEGYGKDRMIRYYNKYQEVYTAFMDDIITLEDIVEVLGEEVKLDLKDLL